MAENKAQQIIELIHNSETPLTKRISLLKQVIAKLEENPVQMERILTPLLNDNEAGMRFFARKYYFTVKKLIENTQPVKTPEKKVPKPKAKYLVEKKIDSLEKEIIEEEKAEDPDVITWESIDEELKGIDNAFEKAIQILHLGKKHPEFLENLLPYLENPNSRIRANTVEVYEYHKDKRFVDNLRPLLQDRDNRTKANTIKYFLVLKDHSVLKELDEMLSSSELWLKSSALYVLDKCYDKKNHYLETLLIKAENDPYDEVRQKAKAIRIKQKKGDKPSKETETDSEPIVVLPPVKTPFIEETIESKPDVQNIIPELTPPVAPPKKTVPARKTKVQVVHLNQNTNKFLPLIQKLGIAIIGISIIIGLFTFFKQPVQQTEDTETELNLPVEPKPEKINDSEKQPDNSKEPKKLTLQKRLELAKILFSKAQYSRALPHYELLYKTLPDFDNTFNLALIYANCKKNPEALLLLKKILPLPSNSSHPKKPLQNLLDYVSQAFKEEKNYAQCAESLHLSYRTEPTPQLHFNTIEMFFLAKKYSEIIPLTQKFSPWSLEQQGKVLYYQTISYFEIKQNENGYSTLKNFLFNFMEYTKSLDLKVFPTYIKSMNQSNDSFSIKNAFFYEKAIIIHCLEGNLSSAKTQFKQFEKLSSDNITKFNLAVLIAYLGEEDLRRIYVKYNQKYRPTQSKSVNGADKEKLLQRIEQLKNAGSVDKAIYELKKLENDPQIGNDIKFQIGMLYLKELADTELAISYLLEVTEAQPSHAPAHFALSESFIEKNDLQNAGEHISKALNYSPNGSFQARCISIINAIEQEKKERKNKVAPVKTPDSGDTPDNSGDDNKPDEKKNEKLLEEIESAKATYKSARAAWLNNKNDDTRRRMKRWERRIEDLESKIKN